MKFFRKMSKKEKVNTKKAIEITLIFYLIALIAHSSYIFFLHGYLNSSFYILIAGLVVFFGSDIIYNKFNK